MGSLFSFLRARSFSWSRPRGSSVSLLGADGMSCPSRSNLTARLQRDLSWRLLKRVGGMRSLHIKLSSSKVFLVMTLAGLEPAIFGSEDQRLIH